MRLNVLHSLFSLQATKPAPNELGPLMEPDPLAFSFDMPGWYFLGGLMILVLAISSYFGIRKYKRNAYRRNAVSQVHKLAESNDALDGSAHLNGLLALLKVVALNYYDREIVASKTGKDWLSFLDSTGKDTSFSSYERVISDSVLRDMAPDEKTLSAFSELTKKWIKTHA